jgi:hypothetical protein
MSKLNGVEAYANMKHLMTSGKTGLKGWCQKTCRGAWELPAGLPSAKAAWSAVPAAHRHTDPSKAPIGAPHFWLGGAFGHVALQSDKKGIVISTDSPATNRVGEVPIDYFAKHWGKKYAGWASNYMKQDLTLTEMPK